jgi:hypothetical protein
MGLITISLQPDQADVRNQEIRGYAGGTFMGRLIVLLIATMTVWGAVALTLVLTSPDTFIYMVLSAAAFLSTAVIWGIGGSIDMGRKHEPTPRWQEYTFTDTKTKRDNGSLTSVVHSLTPEQIATLEIALQRRRDTFDEDDQILANHLSAELERAGTGRN